MNDYPTFAVLGALAVFLLIVPLTGLFPPIKNDADRSKNTILNITLRSASFYEQRGVQLKAIAAQEAAEWYLRWLVALPLAAAAVWAIGPSGPYAWAVEVVLLLLATLWSAALYAQVDLVGRAAEVVEDGRPEYLQKAALRLINGFRGNFKDREPRDVEAMIRRRLPLARVLVAIMGRVIKRGSQ